MRLLPTIKNDVCYQIKYGFYLIYSLLTILYVLILQQITDPTLKSTAGSLVMLSDPAVLGYFFIGGIWLLEKDESLHSYIAVTPLKTAEYVLSKIFYLGIVSTLSATIIGFLAIPFVHALLLAAVIFLSSCFFTLLGLIFATFSKTLNGYLLASVPPALLLLTPAILTILGIQLPFTNAIPGTIVFKLINGTLSNDPTNFLIYFIELFLWTGAAFILAVRCVQRETEARGEKRHAINT